MNKALVCCLAFMLVSSAAFADTGPARHIPCNECIYRCFDCCKMQQIAPMPGCGSCYFGGCDYEKICDDYLAEHPNKCPGRVKDKDAGKLKAELEDLEADGAGTANSSTAPNVPETDGADTSHLKAELEDPEAMGEDAGDLQAKPEIIDQPKPVENKRSCSAMMYASGQSGVWAIMSALIMGMLMIVRRRRNNA